MPRKALIIGISGYPIPNDLENPINDARAMDDILKDKGFKTNLYLDVTMRQLRDCFDQFVKEIKEGDILLFYYAGHGVEYRDVNYLIPIDICHPIEDNALSLDEIQNSFNKKNGDGIKIVILDACRDTVVGFETQGLKKEISNRNTLIAFSTSPGNVAKDGVENLSRYTKNLISSIQEYNLTINEVFEKTRELLIRETQFSQIPWEHSSLTDRFSFDTMSVPSLSKIFRANKYVNSIKTFNDIFVSASENEFITFYGKSFEGLRSLECPLQSVIELDTNKDYIVGVGDKTLFQYDIAQDNFDTEIFSFDLHTVSNNSNNIICVCGELRYGALYDFNSKQKTHFDIGEEIVSHLYKGEEQKRYFAKQISIYCSAFSPLNDNILAIGGGGHIFGIRDISNGEYLYVHTDKDLFQYTYSIDFSLDGRYIATAHDGGKTILWDSQTFEVLHIFQVNEFHNKIEFFEIPEETRDNTIHHVEFSPDSKVLAVGTSESKVVFFDVKYKTMIGELDLNIEPISVYGFTFSEDGKGFVASINERAYLFQT